MRAYNLAMAWIFINCGFPLAVSMGGFGNIQHLTSTYDSIKWIAEPVFKVGTFEIGGSTLITALAAIMLVGTLLFLNSRPFNSQGVAYVAFAAIFWIPYATTSAILLSIGTDFPGINIFWGILSLVSVMIFAIALIQLPTGGQKSHV